MLVPMFASSQHRRDCARKQQELRTKRQLLPTVYSQPLTDDDQKILGLSLSQVVDECNATAIAPSAVLQTYTKRSLLAQDATNCLADFMISEVEKRSVPLQRPLTGVVVSLKDCIDVEGYDTTCACSGNVGHPRASSAPIVRLLRDAGAQMHVKTTLPTGFFSLETLSDLFGETSNPYNPAFSPGASTGGGGALLAYQGTLIEIGSDIAGSLRYPAAYCGVYGMKGSVGRFPSYACESPLPGLEGVPTIVGPMARTLDDLAEFWKRVVDMRPWLYDHTCSPLPWRPVDFVLSGRKPKWGIVWSDGVIPPSPAALRALNESVDALRRAGHEVVDFHSPNIVEGLKIGYKLLFSDGGETLLAPMRKGETLNGGLLNATRLLQLPLFVKKALALLLRSLSRPTGRNDAWAALLETFHEMTPADERRTIVEREAYRAAWHTEWQAQGIDFVLTIPHSLPPIPRGETGTVSLVSSGYTFIFNILDYAAGVLPVTYVDELMDCLPEDFVQSKEFANFNDIARGAYSVYDSSAMHGLPMAVQVVGQRLEEEKVLAGMKIVEQALWEAGKGFAPKKF
ncbi:uncharacterized protein FIBRA_06933 [Fibroporia radiculosa]|uniref:Amidase domain-containing protein n=1 Tax=Fibroporia radiculosa TaxID=599839 RepID=J4GCX5_9APHY|nr:uncharacterized protein FIBRA_06933 [Fibroporia radiculosa]CCM04743.1 predicted protein [Fibroporia radiculosa]